MLIPKQFQPHQLGNYPSDNKIPFEEWLSKQPLPKLDRIYLPIHWTAYYCNNKYGQDIPAYLALQKYIDKLDKGKKYWTVVQYDDGILNSLVGLDIQVFSMSGHPMHNAIPLLCQPHIFHGNPLRYIFANFIGGNTHPIRKKVFAIKDRRFLISEKRVSLAYYCDKLKQSIFTLAPRGYGPTSFRIAEAMQFGSIPVYISDRFIEPYGIPFEEYGVKVHDDELKNPDDLAKILRTVNVKQKQAAIKELYPQFTYEGCKQYIINNIKK